MGSDLWAALGGLACGVSVAGLTRWGPRGRRFREISVPLGWNLGALALLAAVFASFAEPGGLAARWEGWLWGFGPALALGALAARFPRAAGIPLAVLVLAGAGWAAGALGPFSSLVPLKQVQPLADADLVKAFEVQVDTLDLPDGLPLVDDRLYRLREGTAPAPELWWPWAEALGWARSAAPTAPADPVKFGIYRLVGADRSPRWKQEAPEVGPPQ